MKKTISIFILMFITFGAIGAEQLSKIGIIDLSTIFSNYFKESQAWRELEEMTRQYEDEKNRIIQEIEQLEERKFREQNIGNGAEALRLEEEILNKKEYLKEYNRIKYNEIKRKRENLLESPSFLAEIMREIKYIAESEGYSVIFQSKDPDIIWWSPQVDITELVLERLRKKSTSRN